MQTPLIYGRSRSEAVQYVVRRESEIAAMHPLLFRAIGFEKLALDQREALCQGLEQIRLPPRIGEATVRAALESPDDPRAEARGYDDTRWGNAEMAIARIVGGARERRDEVRMKFGLAVRIARLATSQ